MPEKQQKQKHHLTTGRAPKHALICLLPCRKSPGESGDLAAQGSCGHDTDAPAGGVSGLASAAVATVINTTKVVVKNTGSWEQKQL